MKKHYRKENDCLNCGAELKGKFCYVCGQENLQIKESFGHMMNHAISDYFHFDHQFFHTLKPLLFKPGKLTIDYMAGKRVQYLHPVKMYIFISLIFFLLLFKSNDENTATHEGKSKHKKELAGDQKLLDSLAKDPHISKTNKDLILLAQQENDKELKAAENKSQNTKNIIDVKGHKAHQNQLDLFENDEDVNRSKDTTYAMYLITQAKLPDEKRDNFFVRHVHKRQYELNTSDKSIEETLVEGIKHAAPKMMFLLLPLFALLLKIAFWKNRKFYVEHLIYSFHFHCFVFLFWSIIMLFNLAIPNGWHIDDYVSFAAFLVVIWYSYKSLRAVYNRSSGRTITKMVGLFFSYSFVLAICLFLMVMTVALFD